MRLAKLTTHAVFFTRSILFNQIASLRKSNAALRAAVNDNELVADETDAALDRAVADCENAQLQLRTVEAELDEAVAEQETTSVELDICRQQLEELRDRGQKKAIEVHVPTFCGNLSAV
jgi:chromosome segregation ATPase